MFGVQDRSMQDLVIGDYVAPSVGERGDDSEQTPTNELHLRLAFAETRAQELIEFEERGSARIELVANLERISYATHVGRVLMTSSPMLVLGPRLLVFGRDALKVTELSLARLDGAPSEFDRADALAHLLRSRAGCFGEIVRTPIGELTDLDRVSSLMALREAFWMLGRHALHVSSFAAEY